jgi:hypothetical protein
MVFLAWKSPYIRSNKVQIYGSDQPYTYDISSVRGVLITACVVFCSSSFLLCDLTNAAQLKLARTKNIHGVFGREITKCTVIYGVYIKFWPTLHS